MIDDRVHFSAVKFNGEKFVFYSDFPWFEIKPLNTDNFYATTHKLQVITLCKQKSTFHEH